MAHHAPEVTAELIPPNFRKHVDPKAPVPLRMMAAKAMVPLAGRDMLTALYLLTRDADPGVAELAQKTASTLTDRILSSALRDEEIHPTVLDFYAGLVTGDVYQEMILLNSATPDVTVARLAETVAAPLVEIISQNQLRLLREPSILRALGKNPNTSPATLDSVLDFAVRSGLFLTDMPQFMEARRRILGEAPPPPEEETAAGVLQEFGSAIAEEKPEGEGSELEEKKRLTLIQRIMKMNVSEKIKLATLGNKEARSICLRDSNKLVQLASIQSPRMTQGEVLSLSNNRTIHDEVLRVIINNRDWTRSYQLKLNLVSNPKTPLAQALKWLLFIHPADLKLLSRNKNVPATIQTQARMAMAKKEKPGGGSGH